MSLGLIWAQSEGGVIGLDGTMPWHVPEDLTHFKAITLGNPVVMGRRTWDSLNPRFRPLPDRRNIVITRQPNWSADGADVTHSLESALALATQPSAALRPAPTPAAPVSTPAVPERTWVIGGGQVYREAIALADRLEVTEINAHYDGDAHAPDIDDTWIAVSVEPAAGWLTSRTGTEYRFLRYDRA